MFTSSFIEYFDKECPFFPFLLYMFKKKQIFFKTPFWLAFAGIKMIEPSLSALFWCSQILFIGIDEKCFGNLVPLCPSIIDNDIVKEIVLLVLPFRIFHF